MISYISYFPEDSIYFKNLNMFRSSKDENVVLQI